MSDQFSYVKLGRCGEDVIVREPVVIYRRGSIRLGNHVAIDSFFYCTAALETGDHVHIGPHVSIIGNGGLLKMGHFTNLAAGCRVICRSDEFNGDGLIGAVIPAQYQDKKLVGTITIEHMANVGTNAVIMPGVTLGTGSVIGANSLVLEDTEPWTIYAGSPAKPIKSRPKGKMISYAYMMGYDLEKREDEGTCDRGRRVCREHTCTPANPIQSRRSGL